MAPTLELHSIADRVEIADGVFMPRLGIGTSHSSEHGDVEREIAAAFDLGYRLIDTAAMYGNERGVGQAIAASSVPREEIFVTTKVWNSDQGHRQTLHAFDESLRRLALDYVDLYLIHWPQPGLTAETWHALEELLARGLVRSIGVCNFMPRDLDELYASATVPPAVNQFELHPFKQRPALQEYCRAHAITIEAWAPVMRGRANQVPQLVEIGERYGKSGAQVSIRWILQSGITTIPKSTHEVRLQENADVFDFELTPAEMSAIDALDRSGS